MEKTSLQRARQDLENAEKELAFQKRALDRAVKIGSDPGHFASAAWQRQEQVKAEERHVDSCRFAVRHCGG